MRVLVSDGAGRGALRSPTPPRVTGCERGCAPLALSPGGCFLPAGFVADETESDVLRRRSLLSTKRSRACSIGVVTADETGSSLFRRRGLLPTNRSQACSVGGVCCRRNRVEHVPSAGLLPMKRSQACSVGGVCCRRNEFGHVLSVRFDADESKPSVFCRQGLLPMKRVRACSVGGFTADETGSSLFCRQGLLPTKRDRACSAGRVCCRRNEFKLILSTGSIAVGAGSGAFCRRSLVTGRTGWSSRFFS